MGTRAWGCGQVLLRSWWKGVHVSESTGCIQETWPLSQGLSEVLGNCSVCSLHCTAGSHCGLCQTATTRVRSLRGFRLSLALENTDDRILLLQEGAARM